MGLPELDFRVPEASWFKAALTGRFAGRFGSLPALSSTGALAWPYKIAVLAVMTLVAGGTLVTFSTAGAETPSTSAVSALPGSDEASPTIEGQVLPPSSALLSGSDLMSSLNLMDYSPGDTTLALSDDDDSDDGDDDSDDEDDAEKKPSAKPTTSTKSPTTKPTTSSSNDSDDSDDSDGDSEPVEGPKHKQWEQDMAEYESDHDEWEDQKATYERCLHDLPLTPGLCADKKPGDEPDDPGSEPAYTS